jgi:hypothetical protein
VEQLQAFTFVHAAMVASVVAFFWLGAAFPAGALRGVRAGRRVLRSGLYAYGAALAAIFAWAYVDGDLARLSETMGLGVLGEMALFVVAFLATVYLMAKKYLNEKAASEAADPVESADA